MLKHIGNRFIRAILFIVITAGSINAMCVDRETAIKAYEAGAKLYIQDILKKSHEKAISPQQLIELCCNPSIRYFFLEILLANFDQKTKDCEGLTALHHATLQSNVDMIKPLLEHGADINAGDKLGLTALHLAIKNDSVIPAMPIINELLAQPKINLKTMDIKFNTALHYAVNFEKPKIVEALLKKSKAPINCPNIQGLTPLHIALLRNNEEIINILIKNGASKNIDAAVAREFLGEI